MRAIVEASLKFRLLVVAAAAAVLVVGASQLRRMPVDVLPEYVPPTVEIQTEALGLSAAEVEQLITVPMEQDLLAGVAFLDDMRSESLPGLSRIFLVFEPGTDLFTARQVVAERMTQAHALPNVSKPPQMLQPLSSTNRVLIVGASSDRLSPIEMGVIARWTITPRLIGVPGVANVSVWGFRDRQLQVQVDPEKLRDKGVSLVQVVETAGNALWFSPLTFVEASTPGTGGFIDTPNQRLGVQHISPLNSAADLAKVRVDDTGRSKILLGDVATVVEDHQPLIGDALVSAGNGDLLFVVEKLPGANTFEVTEGLEDAIEALKPGLAGVEFDTSVYRPASYLERALENLTVGMGIGAGLLALALIAFLFNWRAVLVAVAAIPLSLVVAALVLWALGTSMNWMILLGLVAALVLVVDDAVTGTENVARRVRQHRSEHDGASAAATIVRATLESRSAATYGALIVALALLPLFFMHRLAGAFFPDVAGAFLIAVAASLLVALTVAPAFAYLLLGQASPGREPPLAAWLQRAYAASLAHAFRRANWVYGASAVVAVAACAAVPLLSTSLLPTLKEEQVLIRWDGPPGTSLTETKRITALASSELRTVPGVRGVGAHVGRAVGSDRSVNANAAELWVSIDPSADHDATLASIKGVVDGYPGLAREVGAFSNERASAQFADRKERDLVVRVYGEDRDVLQQQAERVKRLIGSVEGTASPSVEAPVDEPTVEVEVDLAAAQAHGIKPGDVRRAAATLVGGLVVGNLFEQQKVFEVVVWGTPNTRASLDGLRQLLIDTPDRRHVRLGQVADVRIAPNPAVIQRHAVSRYLDVGATVSGRDRGAVLGDVERRLAELAMPLEYHTEVLGGDGQPRSRLIVLAIAAAIGIFLLLQACFGSARLATLCFLTFPLALSGGVLAALADGGTVSFGTVIGLFAVFGITVRAGIRLVERWQLELQHGHEPGPALVQRGAEEQVTPVMLTALAAALALLPLVVAGGMPGYELVHSAAVVVVAGLVTSTLLSLFVMPVLYLRFAPAAAAERATAPAQQLVPDLMPAPAAAAKADEAADAAGVHEPSM